MPVMMSGRIVCLLHVGRQRNNNKIHKQTRDVNFHTSIVLCPAGLLP